MAKRIPLSGEWTLLGRAPFDPEDVRLPLSLPGTIQGALKRRGLLWGSARYGEWLFLRSWRFARRLQRPAEPPEGESERYHLHLGGLQGRGQLLADGQAVGPLEPWGQLELSQFLLEGACELELRFEPALLDAERALPALLDAPLLVASYFARIVNARAQGFADGRLEVRLQVQGYGQGRVQLKYRLVRGDALCASLTAETRLQARMQTLCDTLELQQAPVLWPEGDSLYTLYIVLERGGARCDSVELSVCFASLSPEEEASPPWLLARLEAGLSPEGLHALGLRATALEGSFSKAQLDALDREGLRAWLLSRPEAVPGVAALERGLAPHACARFAGGLGYFFPDGSPADGRDPGLRALDALVREAGLLPFHAGRLDPLPLPEGGPGLPRALALFDRLTAARQAGERRALDLFPGLLTDGEGRPTLEAAAVFAALSPVSVRVRRPAGPLFPGMALRLELSPLGELPGVSVLEAQLYSLDGLCLKDGAFSLGPYDPPGTAVFLEARLPCPLQGPLLLRLRLRRGESLLWQWDQPLYPEDPSLCRLADTQLLLAPSAGAWYAVNKGSFAALGLLAGNEPRLTALLPGESLHSSRIAGGEGYTWIRLEEEHVSC